MRLWLNRDFEKTYIWGAGKLFYRYFNQLAADIVIEGIIDSDRRKHGNIWVNEMQVKCCGTDILTSNDIVIIAIENPKVVNEIASFLESKGIKWWHLFDVVDTIFVNSGKCLAGEKKVGKIKKFIDVMVPIAKCNMKCEYCYLSHINVDFDKVTDIYHHPKYIRYALSQKRLGGSAFINLCGVGETLFCDNIVEIVDELLKEGHYVQIVTNATVTNVIKQFVESNVDATRLFFKCSFHFEELVRLGLLDKFAENVWMLEKWGASYSIEYVPIDASCEYIDEIKNFCLEKFGALPHVTVTRDERYEDYRILTSLPMNEYKKIWGQFCSDMFDFKIENVGKKSKLPCKAGKWSAELNLATGDLFKCTNNPFLCNIYQDIDGDIKWEEVGENCCCAYCFNNHAYMTMGLIPEFKTPTYLDMRDRIKKDGQHWINETLRSVFVQKLYENNGCENDD